MPTPTPPLKFNELTREQFIRLITTCGSVTATAALLGCSGRTIYNIVRNDPQLKQQLRAMRACDEIKLLRCIDRAAENPRHWRAAAWKLERQHPARSTTS